MAVQFHRFVAAAAVTAALMLSACAPDTAAETAVPATPTAVLSSEPEATPAAPTIQPAVQESESPLASDPPSETPSETPEPAPSTPAVAEPTTPTSKPTSSPTSAPKPKALIKPGDSGDMVRELQHRLQQIEWFEGKITPTYGDQTRLAVEGFQGKRGLPITGEVDRATWDRLLDMTRTPTKNEMYNVLVVGPALLSNGDKGDSVKDLQARLKQIGWFSGDVTGNYGPVTVESVKGFQAKREIPVTGEVDQRTLDRLHGMTRTPTANELNNITPTPAAEPSAMTLDDRCLEGRVICISKAQRMLAWVVDGEIRMQMQVRFGSELTPTRNGVFSVGWKSRDHVSSLYDTPMPFALFFSGGQAIHYSPDFAANGYNGASHGCVNVRDKAAVASLFDTAKVGDKVVVYTD